MAVEVGVRELRNNSSEYLNRVEAGEEVVVTIVAAPSQRVLPLQR